MKDGKKDGLGIMTYKNGDRERQEWINGRLISETPL